MDHKKKLLVIEDEVAILSFLRSSLETNGWEVLEARTGRIGLELAASRKPDVILLDLNLPGIGGMELCHRMKGDPRLSHIPIVILTGAYKEVRDRVRGLERGADDYILKPFDAQTLLAKIKFLTT